MTTKNNNKLPTVFEGQWIDQVCSTRSSSDDNNNNIHSDTFTESYNSKFAQQLVSLTLHQYNKLPKNGKPSPQKKEWTLLASICMCIQNEKSYTLSVVSLGTGTKCLGYEVLPNDGSRVHDSHAEVMARRAFMRFLYSQLQQCLEGKDGSIFVKREASVVRSTSDEQQVHSTKRPQFYFELKSNISFHFFVNQSPCGDASIHHSNDSCSNCNDDDDDETVSNHISTASAVNEFNKRLRDQQLVENGSEHDDSDKLSSFNNSDNADINNDKKRAKITDNNHGRTGARPITTRDYIPGTETDLEFGDIEQQLGIVRTKPGRGPRTISMSCSDKLSKWNILGIQGALLSFFIPDPIRMSTITIGNSKYFDPLALKRAFRVRMEHIEKRIEERAMVTTKAQASTYIPPHFLCCDIEFPDGKSDDRTNACSNSMLFVTPDTVEVIIGHRGHKLGVGKKDLDKAKCFSSITKYKFLDTFYNVRKLILEHSSNPEEQSDVLEYGEAKGLASDYAERRQLFLQCDPFVNWVITDAEKFYRFKLK